MRGILSRWWPPGTGSPAFGNDSGGPMRPTSPVEITKLRRPEAHAEIGTIHDVAPHAEWDGRRSGPPLAQPRRRQSRRLGRGEVADRKKKKATRSTGSLPGQQRRHDHHAEDEHSQAHRTGSRAPTVAASTVLTSTPGVYAGLCRRRRNCHLSPSASSALVRIHRKSLALTTGGCLTGISPMTPGVHPHLRQASAVVHSLSAGLPGRRLG